jgi:MFS family permease
MPLVAGWLSDRIGRKPLIVARPLARLAITASAETIAATRNALGIAAAIPAFRAALAPSVAARPAIRTWPSVAHSVPRRGRRDGIGGLPRRRSDGWRAS